MHTAVNEFLKNLEPGDEEFPVTFADRPELRLPLTSDPPESRRTVSSVKVASMPITHITCNSPANGALTF